MIAAAFLLGSEALAGSYGPQPFDFPDNTTNLGDGTQIASTPAVASVQAAALRLTQAGVGGTQSSFKLPDLDPAKELESFTATFRVRMARSGTATPADGWSFNVGAIPGGSGGGEGGFALSNGLVIAWDTYDNGGDTPSIEAFANGISIGNAPQSFPYEPAGTTFRNVTIHWDADGLDVTYNSVNIFTNLQTPGFIPAPGNTFAFSGRTGGATQDTILDDLSITTATVSPLETGGPVISEFVADNDSFEDEDTDTPDWIEIYNGQNASVSLGGYYLTNDAASKTKWQIPALTIGPYQYRLIYASGKNRTSSASPLHTNFTLPKSGGYVALVNPDGTTVVSESAYGPQAKDISYGTKGAAQTRGYLNSPSPGIRNGGEQAGAPPTEEVVFSRPGGLITATIELSIAAPAQAGAVVRYTLDNTVPQETSPVYSAPFSISTRTTVRARTFAPGHLPGPVSSRTFLRLDTTLTNYNGSGQPFNSNLPIVVLDSFGVPVDNFTGQTGRPFRITYSVVLDRDPQTGRAALDGPANFQGRSGTHVRGESSAGFPQRQYAWELWDNDDRDKPSSILGLPKESDWILYAPWSEKSLMRDFIIFGTMRKLRPNDYMAVRTKFCEVFFNQTNGAALGYSSYRGVYLLKEKIKVDADRVDIEKINDLTTASPNVAGGYIFRKDKADPDSNGWTTSRYSIPLQSHTPDIYNAEQLNYIRGYMNSFEAALAGGNFAHPTLGYAGYIDADSFIDAQWFVEWTKQVDGYVFSTYYHKPRNGKVRAGPIWDFNIALGNANYATGEEPTGWYQNSSGGVGQLWYPRLHADPNYRLRHFDRYWEMRRGLLSTDAILGEIDATANYLLDGIATPVSNNASPQPPAQENGVMRHYRKHQILGSYQWPNPAGFGSRTTYQSEVTYLKTWLNTRLNWLDDQDKVGNQIYRPVVFSVAGGPATGGTQLSIDRYAGTPPAGFAYPAGGTIYYTVDGTDPRAPGGAPAGSAYTGPITLNASQRVKARLQNGAAWTPLMSADFIVDAVPANASNLVITELLYQPAGPTAAEMAQGYASGGSFEFIELANIGAVNIDLTGVHFTEGVTFDFTGLPPEKVTLSPGGRVLLVADKAAFLMRYGAALEPAIAGEYGGNFDNASEEVILLAADGSVIAQFTYGLTEPWPVDASGSGYSLVLNHPASAHDYAAGESWRSSAQLGGAPAQPDSAAFTGSPTGDTDQDGIADVAEFAMGSDWNNPSARLLPAVSIAEFSVNGQLDKYLRVDYRRNLAADADFTVRHSFDLATWPADPALLSYVGTTNNGDGTATVTYRSIEPVSSIQTPVFIRLQIGL